MQRPTCAQSRAPTNQPAGMPPLQAVPINLLPLRADRGGLWRLLLRMPFWPREVRCRYVGPTAGIQLVQQIPWGLVLDLPLYLQQFERNATGFGNLPLCLVQFANAPARLVPVIRATNLRTTYSPGCTHRITFCLFAGGPSELVSASSKELLHEAQPLANRPNVLWCCRCRCARLSCRADPSLLPLR